MNNEEFAQKNTCCLKKVLVTGASGFIGSFLVEGGLEREMQVWAGVRKSSSRTSVSYTHLTLPTSNHV